MYRRERIIARADKDRNGRLNYNEFVQLVYCAHSQTQRNSLTLSISDNLSLIQEHCQEADGLYHKLLLK